MVGILVSFWDGLFSGAMFVFEGVSSKQKIFRLQGKWATHVPKNHPTFRPFFWGMVCNLKHKWWRFTPSAYPQKIEISTSSPPKIFCGIKIKLWIESYDFFRGLVLLLIVCCLELLHHKKTDSLITNFSFPNPEPKEWTRNKPQNIMM